MDSHGNALGEPRQAFELPAHASYPYLFRHEDDIYCIAESAQARDTVLWKALQYPTQWTRVTSILSDIAVVDPTIVQHEGLWWLFCTDADNEPNTNLYIWYAESLQGPWAPHALNPVKTDVRSARPAGTPFVYNDNLYRPAQDCSRTYGGGITICRVDRLTPTEYSEKEVTALTPEQTSPFADGLHTIAEAGRFTVFDAKRHVFLLSGVMRQIRIQLRRLRSSIRAPDFFGVN